MCLRNCPHWGLFTNLGVKLVLKPKTCIGVWKRNRRILIVFIFLISLVFSCACQYVELSAQLLNKYAHLG